MKIVYYSTTGTLGGAELCLLDVLEMVRAARPTWRLRVLLGEDGPLREKIEALGLPCAVLPLSGSVARLGDAGLAGGAGGSKRAGGGILRLAAGGPRAAAATASYLRRLRRSLRQEAPDWLQTNSMKAHVLGAWAAPAGLPIAWHMHDYAGSRPVMARLLRWSARLRPGLTAVGVSRSVAADAARVLGGRADVRTIVNAIDLDRFVPGPGDGPALDRAAGLPEAPPGTVRVGLVATFARWKGHEPFLEAASRIPPDRPCRFYIVGGPIYRSVGSQYTLEELRGRAAALGLADRLGFAGYQANPASALRALDVVVHASTRPEPFGRVIVEGMACGRAVVASLAGGAAELFEPGVSALGCPPGDPGALASAIDRLVGDAGLRQRLGEEGRRVALEGFDRRRLADQWLDVYGGNHDGQGDTKSGQAGRPRDSHPEGAGLARGAQS